MKECDVIWCVVMKLLSKYYLKVTDIVCEGQSEMLSKNLEFAPYTPALHVRAVVDLHAFMFRRKSKSAHDPGHMIFFHKT